MRRGLLFEEGVKPQFSGHETFPLRHGWLKKAYDSIREVESLGTTSNNKAFSGADAIARFGVGKNMAVSMRHWALATQILDVGGKGDRLFRITPLGRALLDDNGWDPWLESPAALWLMHWQLASTPHRTTTWYWCFNHLVGDNFSRDTLVDQILKVTQDLDNLSVKPRTVQRDVECFIRTYVARPMKGAPEDSLECPLTELRLIKPSSKKGEYRMNHGPKPSLPTGLIIYALVEYWARLNCNNRTLNIESLLHEPGSPGRVFQLDEDSLSDRLLDIEALTGGRISWSETAGLKQLIVNDVELDAMSFLPSALTTKRRLKMAKAANR